MNATDKKAWSGYMNTSREHHIGMPHKAPIYEGSLVDEVVRAAMEVSSVAARLVRLETAICGGELPVEIGNAPDSDEPAGIVGKVKASTADICVAAKRAHGILEHIECKLLGGSKGADSTVGIFQEQGIF